MQVCARAGEALGAMTLITTTTTTTRIMTRAPLLMTTEMAMTFLSHVFNGTVRFNTKKPGVQIHIYIYIYI